MEFYQSVFGGDLTISTFADRADGQDEAEQDKIMHCMLDAPGADADGRRRRRP